MVQLTREEGGHLMHRLDGHSGSWKDRIQVPRSDQTKKTKHKAVYHPGRFKHTKNGNDSLNVLTYKGTGADEHHREVLFVDEPELNRSKLNDAYATHIVSLPESERKEAMVQAYITKLLTEKFIGINIRLWVRDNIDQLRTCTHERLQADNGLLASSSSSYLNNTHQQQPVSPPSSKPPVVDNSFAQRAMIVSLQESAQSSYMNGDYQTSILKYTTAITTYNKMHFTQEVPPHDDLLSVLLSNRAAGLLMVGAFEAAVQDCQQALQIVSDPAARLIVSSGPGPELPSKIYTQLGRALIKLGEATSSESAFDQAIQSAKKSLGLCMTIPENANVHRAKKVLQRFVTKATLGKTDAARLRDTMDHVTAAFTVACQSPSMSARPKFVEALGHVNLALSSASGCSALHQKKVAILARLKRWREIANHCERLACDNVRFDNVFTDDLVSKHPFLGIRPAKSLVADFFRRYEEGDAESIDLKLGSKAAAEAVLRIPDVVSPYYVRALRLEERYLAAEVGLTAIEGYISSSHSGGVGDHGRLQARFSWVPQERGKVSRTKTGKDRGDELYLAADYDMAAAQYAMCLTIDSEGIASDDIDGSNAGGRLHAVLHCNGAACFMALRRFNEAVTECTAALRIHVRYMKALLRRARCFHRLDRHDEAIAEYRRWMDMVQEAKRTPLATAAAAANVFDGPHDATDDDILRVNREFEAVSKAKADHEAAARAEATYRQQRQSWKGTQQQQQQQQYQGDAQRRRDFFYSQKGTGSRRWDSFRERGPKSSSSSRNMGGSGAGGAGGNHSNRSGDDSKPRGGGTGNSTSGLRLDTHYTTLGISRNATAADIKKAYRKLALKYHPDKNSTPEASELFGLVNEAYEVLLDTTTRRKYDAGLSRFR